MSELDSRLNCRRTKLPSLAFSLKDATVCCIATAVHFAARRDYFFVFVKKMLFRLSHFFKIEGVYDFHFAILMKAVDHFSQWNMLIRSNLQLIDYGRHDYLNNFQCCGFVSFGYVVFEPLVCFQGQKKCFHVKSESVALWHSAVSTGQKSETSHPMQTLFLDTYLSHILDNNW